MGMTQEPAPFEKSSVVSAFLFWREGMNKEAEKDGEVRTHLVIRRRVKNLLKARAALAGVSLERYIERMLTQSPTGGEK